MWLVICFTNMLDQTLDAKIYPWKVFIVLWCPVLYNCVRSYWVNLRSLIRNNQRWLSSPGLQDEQIRWWVWADMHSVCNLLHRRTAMWQFYFSKHSSQQSGWCDIQLQVQHNISTSNFNPENCWPEVASCRLTRAYLVCRSRNNRHLQYLFFIWTGVSGAQPS